jgi:hypothetical protein
MYVLSIPYLEIKTVKIALISISSSLDGNNFITSMTPEGGKSDKPLKSTLSKTA